MPRYILFCALFSFALICLISKTAFEIWQVKISTEYPLRPPLFTLSLLSDGPQSFEWYNELRAMEAEVCGCGIIFLMFQFILIPFNLHPATRAGMKIFLVLYIL